MPETLDLQHADAEDAVLPRAPEGDTGGHIRKRWGFGFWLSALWLVPEDA